MQIVENKLSFIKNNYIKQEEESKINDEDKNSKKLEKKKKKKYTRRFKILKYCLMEFR